MLDKIYEGRLAPSKAWPHISVFCFPASMKTGWRMVKPLRADWPHLRLALCLTFCFLFSVFGSVSEQEIGWDYQNGHAGPVQALAKRLAFCCVFSVCALLSGRDVGQDCL